MDDLHEREPLSTAEAHQLVRRIIAGGGFVLTDHARERMEERDLTTPELLSTLRGGTMQEPEYENGEWRYKVSTPKARVVVSFCSETELTIVSCWRI